MPACPKCGANVEATAKFCASCGSPLAPAVAAAPVRPPAYPPVPEYVYYPPKRNNTALIVVIVVVLVVAVPTALAAILYVMVSGLIDGPTSSKPVVTFASPVPVASGEQLIIASVSMVTSVSDFRVNLQIESQTGTSAAAPGGSGPAYRVYVPVGAGVYAIEWTDIGGEGTLSAGDSYLVSATNGSWPAGVWMSFYLLWNDGSMISSVSWYTEGTSKPVVAFGTPIPITSGVSFTVAATSTSVSPTYYRVNLQVNTTTGSAVAMPTTGGSSVSITVAGYNGAFSVAWTDIGGEGLLNGGDVFSVTRTGGLPAGSNYTFYLLWSDGSTVAAVMWSTA